MCANYISTNRYVNSREGTEGVEWNISMEEFIEKYPEGGIVRKAFDFAEELHRGVTRKSGEPYMTHPLAVAKTVEEWGLDEHAIAAALLHDTVEDTSASVRDIQKKFGDEIAFLVEGLTKIQNIQYPKKDTDTENVRKLILSFSKDLRVILVKLADRLHNMKTLNFMTPEKRKEISWETVEIYAPLAYRLGMQKASGDLEDLAFPHLFPDEYAWLKKNVGEVYETRALYAEKIKPVIKSELLEGGVHPLAVDSRAKHYYSLWKKLMRYDMDLEKIYDLVALRIIVPTVEDCYAALGVIHKHWQPLPGRFKDYIANPKSNGYRSLHTTVFCVDGKITEIQIRTKEMHEENEIGVAAHWAYAQTKKSGGDAKNWKGVSSRKELLWVEQLRTWQSKFKKQEDFLNALKVEFFKDRVFAVTPENDIVDLPFGATPVDFAYQIHREIGEHCVGAKINGKIVPLDTQIRSGDIVEILTQQKKKPSEDWLRFVKTSMAKKYIRSSLRKRIKSVVGKKPEGSEFRIIAANEPGYLKELAGIFGDAKVNILSMNSQSDKRHAFALIHLKCGSVPKLKMEKILTRIKGISGTKEVSWKEI